MEGYGETNRRALSQINHDHIEKHIGGQELFFFPHSNPPRQLPFNCFLSQQLLEVHHNCLVLPAIAIFH